jgi:hypothetical protein
MRTRETIRSGLRKGRREKARERRALLSPPAPTPEVVALPNFERESVKLYALLLKFGHSPQVKQEERHPHLRGLRPLFLKARLQPGAVETLASLLCRIQRHQRENGLHRAGFDPVLAKGLLHLALRRTWWLRPLESWRPTETAPRPLFYQLARHLLARYAVPAFFDAAWLGEEDTAFQHAFRIVGQGKNLVGARLPVGISKRMAHLVMTKAPANLRSLLAAIRWAQARAAGGSPELAGQVAASPLADKTRDEAFVTQLVGWLARQEGEVRVPQVGPLIDYLLFERESPREAEDRHRLPEGFTFQGRTAVSLLERMETWHEWLRWRTRFAAEEWAGCGVGGWTEGKPGTRWEVTEITEAAVLVAEGAAMQHCVASYGSQCIEGWVSIWSVRQETPDGWRRALTVRVSRLKVVVEARGRCNASVPYSPGNELLQSGGEVLVRWAVARGLTIASGVL